MHLINRPVFKLLLCVGLLGALLGGYWFFQPSPPEADKNQAVPIPVLPAVTSSLFRNAQTGAEYVGQETCISCHSELGRSYQHTAHAQALAPVDPSQEPESTAFAVDDGHRRYRIYRKNDEVWHQESLRTSQGEELILSEYPMRWEIGSGHFSQSYLAEVDGFLVQSPVTWYRSRPGHWGLSPGYERYNSSFERTTELRCILCHVGRAEPREGSFHRVSIQTQAIDCERCHGPGSLHVTQRSEGFDLAEDFSIVHPGRLDRERSEAICAQCHLHGAAIVEIRGRQMTDFRPSLALTDFAIPYGLETPSKKMQVVGHVEQMRLSRCYQETQTLTCITCHNPHSPTPSEPPDFFRKTCLECHKVDSCGLEVSQRMRQEKNDNCMACHMPKSPTDIPHFAFTHHRIGIHTESEEPEADAGPHELVPLADVSKFSPLDQDRNLGLAYLQMADHPEHLKYAGYYQSESRRLLESVHARGLTDPAVDAALARLCWQADPQRTMEFAKSVLASPEATPDERSTALFTLATTYFQQGEHQQAVPFLEELVRVRRYADAWHVLSLCREEADDIPGAIAASVKAAEISPIRPQFQQRLVALYEQTDRPELAAPHRRRLRQLELYHQQHP